nr:NAD-dependent epimerase/dehydratase family protein [candidate division Zixibacteria bacterium]
MPEENKKSILITGANGFVGSRLCRQMIAGGYHVIAGVRDGCDASLIDDLKLDYRFGDILHPETLAGMVDGVDYIIHNAGVVKVKNPEMFFTVNQTGTINILNAAKTNSRLKKLVYISSMAASGPSQPGYPRTEDMKPEPVTVYGRSKLAGEQEVLRESNRINSVILRPSGVYGPGDKEMYAFFGVLNNRIKPYLGNLRRRIQLVHVDDLALAAAKALKADTVSGSIYFVAEGRSYSYYQLVKNLRKAVGRSGLPIYIPGFMLKITALVSERTMKLLGKVPMFTTDKAKELLGNWEVSVVRAGNDLGFEAEISFPEGARETVYWYRDEGWL